MSKMRLELHPSLEAYVAENGDICLKQGSADGEDKVINIPLEHIRKVIDWLQILDREQEYKSTDNDDFIAED